MKRGSSIQLHWLLFIVVAGLGACTVMTKVDRAKIDSHAEAGASSDGQGGEGGSAGSAGAAASEGGTGGTSEGPDAEDVVVEGEFPVALESGLAPTPPMGWSSWNTFACNIKATDVVRVADTLVSTGMKDAGYTYVNIDDCWQEALRDAEGNVQVSATFLSGYDGTMQTLVDYVHSRGLKLGLYSDRGTKTCGGRAGALGYEARDAATYAAWGIDYLKYDNCFAEASTIQNDYQLMRDALNTAVASSASQRPIVYSLCAWNFYEWGVDTGQLWRTTTDITANWSAETTGSVVACATINTPFAAYNGPNHWNDPDMLEVGVGKLASSLLEQRSHFNLWAMMAAPLIAGNDVTKMSDAVRSILTNQRVIAVDQDPMGLQGFPVRTTGDVEVWMKPLGQQGARAVLLLNKGSTAADITMNLTDLNLAPGPLTLEDLWSGEVQSAVRAPYTAKAVEPHASVMLKVVGTEPPPPRGTQYLSDLTWIYAANGNGPVERDRTVGTRAAGDGVPITLDGIAYEKGLGVAGGSKIIYRLGKACHRFSAKVNLDDTMTMSGSIAFAVYADDDLLYRSSDVKKPDSATDTVDVDLTDKYRLTLVVTNGMDTVSSADRGVWADAKLECD